MTFPSNLLFFSHLPFKTLSLALGLPLNSLLSSWPPYSQHLPTNFHILTILGSGIPTPILLPWWIWSTTLSLLIITWWTLSKSTLAITLPPIRHSSKMTPRLSTASVLLSLSDILTLPSFITSIPATDCSSPGKKMAHLSTLTCLLSSQTFGITPIHAPATVHPVSVLVSITISSYASITMPGSSISRLSIVEQFLNADLTGHNALFHLLLIDSTKSKVWYDKCTEKEA